MSVSTLEARVREIEANFSGEVAVAAKELGSGEQLSYGADRVYPTASLIKLPILVELWRQAGEGTVSLGERVPVGADDRQGGTGILKALDAGLEPTVRDLGVLMTVLSDNTATNILIDLLGGAARVYACMSYARLDSIHLVGPVDFEEIAKDNRNLGEASCADMMRLMEMLVGGEILDRVACDEVLEVLKGQQLLDQIPRYVSYNPWAKELEVDQELVLANKTGVLLGMRSDVGALWLGGGRCVTYAVTAQNAADTSVGPENEAIVVVGLIGRAIVEQWSPDPEVPLLPTAYLAAGAG